MVAQGMDSMRISLLKSFLTFGILFSGIVAVALGIITLFAVVLATLL